MPDVVDKSKGMDTLLRELKFLDNHAVDIGILAQPDPESANAVDVRATDYKWDENDLSTTSVTVGEVAGYHELGAGPDLPKRSFVVSTVVSKTLDIETELARQMSKVMDGKSSGKRALQDSGKFVRDLMQTTIRTQDGIMPLGQDRKAQRRARGTGTTPLLDTRQIINAIRYAVSTDL